MNTRGRRVRPSDHEAGRCLANLISSWSKRLAQLALELLGLGLQQLQLARLIRLQLAGLRQLTT